MTIDAADGVATADAVLVARGGDGGAGIGGGWNTPTGKIGIDGGTVEAERLGADDGHPNQATVTITGGAQGTRQLWHA